MKPSIAKPASVLLAAGLAFDVIHLKADPHPHNDQEEGPPIHSMVARQSSNYVTSVTQIFGAGISNEPITPIDWYASRVES